MTRPMFRALLFCITMLLLLVSACTSTNPGAGAAPPLTAIRGIVVTPEDSVVAGAFVRAESADANPNTPGLGLVETDTAGVFEISVGLEPGIYTLEATYTSDQGEFVGRQTNVPVEADQVTMVKINIGIAEEEFRLIENLNIASPGGVGNVRPGGNG